MTSTTTLERPATKPRQSAPEDVYAELGDLRKSCQTRVEYYRKALHAVARHFASPYAVVHITDQASTFDERVRNETDATVHWESVVEPLLLESQTDNKPTATLFAVEGASLQVAVLATAVCDTSHHPIGALALVTRCDRADLAKAYLAELGAMVSLVAMHASAWNRNQHAVLDDDRLKRAVVRAADFESLHELAFAVTNSLKNKFDCDRVILGQVQGGRVHILSVSGLDNVYPKSPGVRHIRQAMEECLDLKETICCQDQDKWSGENVATSHRLHQRWHKEVGGAPVASIPLVAGDHCVAIVSMIRSKEKPFTADELGKIHETTEPFAAGIQLVAKADRPWSAHTIDSVKRGLRWFLTPKTPQRKLAVGLLLAAAIYFCFATIGYQVTVPVRIAPAEIRNFSAPFEATIKASYVEVGDEVDAGQLLYELETTALDLRKNQLESELAVLQLRATQSLMADDRQDAALAAAEMQVVEAQRMITLENLAQTQVRAPVNGTIVAGELGQRIGQLVPMGEPLIELVPQGNWSIELEIPETSSADMKVGLTGSFACNPRPGESLDCLIIHIQPSSEARDGKNVFIAEASVDGNPTWMRVGMEGVATIDVGRRSVWWVCLHRMIDALRLSQWL